MSAPAAARPAPEATRRNAYWRLLGVELRRFGARSAVRWLLVAMLAVVAVTALAAYRSTVPPSAEQLQQARQMYEEQHAVWAENGDEQLQQCLEQQAAERERQPDQKIEFACDQMEPRLEWFLPGRTTFAQSASSWLFQESTLLAMLAMVVGATFVAAEFATGNMSTWLTFEPRRTRVFTSKVVVVTLLTGVAVTAVAAVAVGVSWVVSGLNDATTDATPALWRALGGQVARTGAAGALAAASGAVLGFLLRHTAAAVAVAVGWFVAVEGILASLLAALLPWTIRLTLTAWLQGGTEYSVPGVRGADGSYAWEMRELATWHGGAVLLGYAVVLTAAALLVFRRRDVA